LRDFASDRDNLGNVGFVDLAVKNVLLASSESSISTGGQHEHQTITQARSDKKLVRTEGRNAASSRTEGSAKQRTDDGGREKMDDGRKKERFWAKN